MKNRKLKKVRNLNITLRNFLSYMLDNVDNFSNELSKEYSESERRDFVYNCTVNTISEFLNNGKTYIIPKIATVRIQQLFQENFKLRQFYTPEQILCVSKLTKNIIMMFESLRLPLDNKDKNDVMAQTNKLIASTI